MSQPDRDDGSSVVVGCTADATRASQRAATLASEGGEQPMVLTAEPKPLDVGIRLVGPPSIERTGQEGRRPRGHKAWAVLAYVVLAERAVSRQQLAELLFSDADDPLGALRWSLAELRRALGVSDALRGDPISSLIAGASIDLDVLSTTGARSALLGMSGELLEGVRVEGCATFESWLIVERSRVSAAIEARLREAALELLADGRASEAVEFASRLVARNPFDEGAHELLVRCLATSGDEPAALQQIAVADDVLRRELGVTPSAALRAAARPQVVRGVVAIGGSAEVQSLLEAGRAALLAGAADAGVHCLQRAVDRSANVDAALRGRALLALGSALVHSVRGRDGEGSAILHEAVRVATRSEDRTSLATAYRELGFVEVQAGRRPTATDWLVRAANHAGDDASLAAILGVHGMSASDSGDYPRVVSSDAFAAEKLKTMQVFGAELAIIESDGGKVTPELTPRMIAKAAEFANEPGTYWTDQLNNADSLVGYRAIGRELLEQMDRPIDVFCAMVGTAGLAMGVSEAFAAVGADTRIVIIEPASTAVISGGEPGTHSVEGTGIGFVPPLLDAHRYDEVRAIDEADGRAMARRLAAEEGLLAGTSTGLNVRAAIDLAVELGVGKTVVTVACVLV